jgi:transposase
MGRTASIIRLTDGEKITLGEWSRAAEPQSVERARIILLSSEGYTLEEVAQRLNTRPARVSKWRRRFSQRRLFGLSDFQRKGKPAAYDARTEERVLALVAQPPPAGYARWNGRLLAAALGDVSQDQVWRLLRRREVQLTRRRSWSIRTGPEFAAKSTDIVGLYLNPPENALVLCVDEGLETRSLEGAEGYLRLTSGESVKNLKHCEGPDGTTSLHAALEMIAGQLEAGLHAQRRCRRKFLEFMNEVVAICPGRKIHVMLNGLNVHKPLWDRWLHEHSQVRLHFSPTYISWLNQVECWFSILGQAASGAAARQLRQGIESFVVVHNQQSTPFEWIKVLAPAAL